MIKYTSQKLMLCKYTKLKIAHFQISAFTLISILYVTLRILNSFCRLDYSSTPTCDRIVPSRINSSKTLWQSHDNITFHLVMRKCNTIKPVQRHKWGLPPTGLASSWPSTRWKDKYYAFKKQREEHMRPLEAPWPNT
jgi:hypothetical protein